MQKRALRCAAECQQPLSLELAKLLVDAGCDPTEQDRDGWDSFVCLADGSHLVDPQATDLFLSAGCRTDLDGCRLVDDEHRIRFDQILKEHAQWKESLGRMSAENSLADSPLDWGR